MVYETSEYGWMNRSKIVNYTQSIGIAMLHN